MFDLYKPPSSVPGAGYWFSGTWAGLQAATTADLALGSPTLTSGYNVALVTDYGRARGTEMAWDGTRWRVADGFMLARLGAAWTGTTGTTPQIVMPPVRLPAGFLAANDMFEVGFSTEKSAAGTESASFSMRIGATGTASDQAIITNAHTASAGVTMRFLMRVIGNTRLRHATNVALTTYEPLTTPMVSLTATQTVGPPADITVSNSLALENFITFTCTMGGSAQTPRVQSFYMRMV